MILHPAAQRNQSITEHGLELFASEVPNSVKHCKVSEHTFSNSHSNIDLYKIAIKAAVAHLWKIMPRNV